MLSSVEICAGAGGQALGLEGAGFGHSALVEIDADCCKTLRLNRPDWNVIEGDVRHFDGRPYRGADLFAGGVPCPPFSMAGKQLGQADDRDLFPEAVRLIDEIRPRAVLLENVRGLLGGKFDDYREEISNQVSQMGYWTGWQLLNASDYGVPQLRPRVAFVALAKGLEDFFEWPMPSKQPHVTVSASLRDLMGAKGWRDVDAWAEKASRIAPTLVGGSKKHGGPDLGPTRARAAWAELGVNGKSLADSAPEPDYIGMPRLTPRMTARIQGFPDDWEFHGRKTTSYRQIGNAFPPPVARALGVSIRTALDSGVGYRLAG